MMRRTHPELTEKTARARAMFGLNPRAATGAGPNAAELAAEHVDCGLTAGQVAIVSGPSGSGKTTVLRALAERLKDRAVPVTMVPPDDGAPEFISVVDLFRSPLDQTIRLLSLAGLADAAVFTRRPRDLSEGQRWRLGLALAMERVGGIVAQGGSDVSDASFAPVTLIVDEFASTLDRTSAMCVAVSLRRWLSRSDRVRVVAATSHDDMTEWLSPELLVRTGHCAHQGVSGAERHRERHEGPAGPDRSAP
jgi:ABC-type ATPase with predicted acetyltransferase domain